MYYRYEKNSLGVWSIAVYTHKNYADKIETKHMPVGPLTEVPDNCIIEGIVSLDALKQQTSPPGAKLSD